MDQSALLSLIPLAALVIVLLRVVVGVSTLGTFSPVLLAISYAQVGLLLGAALTVGLFVIGFLAQPLLRRLHLPRVARLAAWSAGWSGCCWPCSCCSTSSSATR